MDKKLAGLIGAVGALASLDSAQAATTTVDPTELLQVQSYAELLEPLPNAMAVLEALDRAAPAPKDRTQLAQFFEHHHHHHHHHHSSYYRRYRDYDAPEIVVVPRYRYYHHHHHHHHHHHNAYYPRYRYGY